MKDDAYEGVWVFNGERPGFAGGVFTSRERAEDWIARNRLSGVLTLYPVDVGVHEWAIERGLFEPKREHHTSAEFIASFTSASMAHYHYTDGRDIESPS